MKLINIIAIIALINSCGQGEMIHGPKGDKGLQGQSCYAESVAGGVNVVCGDGTNFIANGQDGQDGEKGEKGDSGEQGEAGNNGTFQGYIEYRTVCPSVNGQYKESLLYLDGQYMAFLSDPNYKKQRLVVLEENKLYKTTDGRGVSFTIVDSEIECL